jgi:hypothetical protein
MVLLIVGEQNLFFFFFGGEEFGGFWHRPIAASCVVAMASPDPHRSKTAEYFSGGAEEFGFRGELLRRGGGAVVGLCLSSDWGYLPQISQMGADWKRSEPALVGIDGADHEWKGWHGFWNTDLH